LDPGPFVLGRFVCLFAYAMSFARFFCVVACALIAVGVGVSRAQEKPRKKMTFYPGAPPAATGAGNVASGSATSGNAAPANATPGEAVPAVDFSGAEAPAQIAGNFFALLQRGDVEKSYAELTRGSKIAERPEDLKTLKAKTREAIEVFGAIFGYELVDSKNVGTRLLRRTYLSLGRDFPLRWRFYFYKSENTWRLIDLRVDDRLAGMFDETEEPRTPLENK
jgi:hypothetical protein